MSTAERGKKWTWNNARDIAWYISFFLFLLAKGYFAFSSGKEIKSDLETSAFARKMRGTAERIRIVPLLVLLIAELICGDASYNVLNREDPCIVLCEKTHISMHGIVHVQLLIEFWLNFIRYLCIVIDQTMNNFVSRACSKHPAVNEVADSSIW